MSSEPQRDIENDLLAYKQRRRELAGAPLELHPATRKMLQSEVARAANRPLLTSEEAAKNFVRSFVMSHQQPSFFARHRHRILWGSAMCACFAVVLTVLRNDPQQTARQNAFPDALPSPPPPAEPQVAQRESVAAKPVGELEKLARAQQSTPASSPAPASLRAVVVAPAVERTERSVMDRRSGAAAAPSLPSGAVGGGAAGSGTTPVTAGRPVASDDFSTRLMREAKSSAATLAAASAQPLDKTLKDRDSAVAVSNPGAKRADAEAKLGQVNSELNRAPMAQAVALSSVAPTSAPVSEVAQTKLKASAPSAAQVTQRFQQVDDRARFRQNFNSPPLPQVLQEFAFERTGDRVRIVDADGSTYEGSVMPLAADETRDKGAAEFSALKKAKTANDAAKAALGVQSADAQDAYFFYANGVNRKLNQSVQFRGEWLPVAPAQPVTATSALQTTGLGGTQSTAPAVEKQDRFVTNTLVSGQLSRLNAHAPSQNQGSGGQISGRAVVGGKNEFDIKAVPK